MPVVSKIKRTVKKALYSDCEWLRDYEVEALIAFYTYLNESDRHKLLDQFERLNMLERSPNGKLTQFFDGLDSVRKGWPENIKINSSVPMEGFQFVIKHNKKISTRFVVFLGGGGLGEIQFIKSPKEFDRKTCKVNQIGGVLSGKPELFEKTALFEKIISDDDEQKLSDELNRSLNE